MRQETTDAELMNHQVPQATAADDVPPATIPSPVELTARRPRPTPDGFRQQLDPLARLRMDLQRRSRENLRRHTRRAVVRVGVLVLFDLATFWLLRAAIRAVRDYAMTGPVIAGFFQTYLPRGYLSGWQFGAALLVSLAVTGNYGQGDRRRNAGRLLAGCALATALPLWMPLWTRSADLVVLQYLLTTVLVAAALMMNRLTVDRIIGVVRDPRRDAVRAVFVGTAEACAAALKNPAFRGAPDMTVLGWVEVGQAASEDSLGGVAELARILEDHHVETVVIAGPMRDETFGHATEVALTAGCHLLALPSETGFPGVQPSVVWRKGEPVLELHAVALRGQQLLLKRALDLALASVALLVAAPLWAAAALLIWLDSPGPVLFSQVRVGQGGRLFRIFKFRTMHQDAEAQRAALQEQSVYKDQRLFKVKDDPRITRIGHWLRRTSIDEVPQLLNVLKGEMSLVGPRPPLPSEVALYELHHYARFDVKPGLTGPWQVGGRNDVTDFEAVIRMETAYIRDWSPLKDFAILLQTIPVVLRMRGAH